MKFVSKNFNILVTGTNQGIGKFLALQLLSKNSNSNFLFTTFQNPEKTLKQSPEFMDHVIKGKLSLKKLDLSNQADIQSFVRQVRDEKWQFDALVNNAAMGFDDGTRIPEIEWAKKLMKTNVYGTIKFTNQLLPFLKENGRIVNVSSRFGALKNHPDFIVKRFQNPNLTENQIYQTSDEFITLCEKGEMRDRFKSAYGNSKMMINAWSRLILKKKLNQGKVSISMSPGRCKTDMRKTGGVHTAQSGAKAIYDCIFMKDPSFEIFYHRWMKSDFKNCGPQIDTEDQFSHYKI